MKKLFFLALMIISFSLKGQEALKKVLVETYYISDANDATDTTGGHLEIGSTTYRVFVQLQKDFKLKAIYGDANHELNFTSTAVFFNNKDRGKTFAKDISKSNFQSNTTALDTWLTLGQSTKTSTSTYFGVLKSQDQSGSFIGGTNNDGGSASIPGGLLINNNSAMGIPLTTEDGMDTMNVLPTNWLSNGFINLVSGADSSIFGSLKTGKTFSSNDAILQNSGVTGVDRDSNVILIAQLTTKGEITFALNLEVLTPDGATLKYVAEKSVDSLSTVYSGWLKYPFVCGCKDPNYLEYNSDYSCSDPNACHTRIVLGCMDINACNYDPHANYNMPSLCCYPGMCADRDISLVCPNLLQKEFKMNLYPSPATDFITIQSELDDNQEVKCSIFNSYGKVQFDKNLGDKSGNFSQDLDISKFEQGIYLVRLHSGNKVISKSFIKL